MSLLDHMNTERCCDCSLQSESVSNSGEVTLSTLPVLKNDQERAPQKNTLTANLPVLPYNLTKKEKKKKHWYVLWATHGILQEVEEFYRKLEIPNFAPYYTEVQRIKKRLKKKRKYVLQNKIFVHISMAEIEELRLNPQNEQYTRVVPDLTKGTYRNRPPMICSPVDMSIFMDYFNVGDKYATVIPQQAKFSIKGDGRPCVVTDGLHKGTIGLQCRYEKQDRVITKVGSLIFATGFISSAFIKPLEEALKEELFVEDERVKEIRRRSQELYEKHKKERNDSL